MNFGHKNHHFTTVIRRAEGGYIVPVPGFVCPTCGTPGMIPKQGECRLSDGTVYPDVVWDECLACGEKVFDGQNTDIIVGHHKMRRKAVTRTRVGMQALKIK